MNFPDLSSELFLHPGEFYFGKDQKHVGTLLGSCIAICVWHPILHIGGMCHYLLPSTECSDNARQMGRTAGGAMRLFLNGISEFGTASSEYQVKVFGGSNSVPSQSSQQEDLIGERNSSAAMELLLKHRFHIEVLDVGETGHRRIVFDLSNGDVWVKRSHLAQNASKLVRPGRRDIRI